MDEKIRVVSTGASGKALLKNLTVFTFCNYQSTAKVDGTITQCNECSDQESNPITHSLDCVYNRGEITNITCAELKQISPRMR